MADDNPFAKYLPTSASSAGSSDNPFAKYLPGSAAAVPAAAPAEESAPMVVTVHGNAPVAATAEPGRPDVQPADATPLLPPAPAAAEPIARPPPAAAPVQAGDASAAIGQGLADGVPVIGPYLAGGLTNSAAVIRMLQNGTTFDEEKRNVEAFNKATAAGHPIAHAAGEIGGAIVGTAPLVAASPIAFGAGAAALPLRAVASMGTGGLFGAADAGARGQDITTGGLTGMALGGAAPAAAKAIGSVVGAVASKFSPPAAAPTVGALKDAARAAYGVADQAGVRIAQPSWAQAVQDIGVAARDAGVDPTIHPKATAALGRFAQSSSMSPSLRDAELMRRIAKGASASIEPDERRIGSIMVGKLDDYLGALKPSDLVSGDAATATDALSKARVLWSRAAKGDRINTAVENAELRAGSTGSGGNAENAIRQEIRKILTSPKQSRGFTADEKAAMARVVRGGPVQNIARLVGKLSPEGNGLMAALGIGATAAKPEMAAIPAIGFAAKKIAHHLAAKNLDALQTVVRSGGQAPVSALALPARQGAEDLVRLGLSPSPVFANQAPAR